MPCVMSKDGASISRSIGLCLGRGAGGSATVSPDWDWDCAIAETAVTATAISATEAEMTARTRSRNIRDDVDHETDDRANKEKRKDRVHQSDATDSRRGDGDIRRLITHRDRKRVIHEIPEVGRRAFGKLEPQVVDQLAVDDRVVVVELHVVKTKINVSQEPREDHREQRRHHVKI